MVSKSLLIPKHIITPFSSHQKQTLNFFSSYIRIRQTCNRSWTQNWSISTYLRVLKSMKLWYFLILLTEHSLVNKNKINKTIKEKLHTWDKETLSPESKPNPLFRAFLSSLSSLGNWRAKEWIRSPAPPKLEPVSDNLRNPIRLLDVKLKDE